MKTCRVVLRDKDHSKGHGRYIKVQIIPPTQYLCYDETSVGWCTNELNVMLLLKQLSLKQLYFTSGKSVK